MLLFLAATSNLRVEQNLVHLGSSLYHICKEKSGKFELFSVSLEALTAMIVWKF